MPMVRPVVIKATGLVDRTFHKPLNIFVAFMPSPANPARDFSPTVRPVAASAMSPSLSANLLLFNAASPSSFETPDSCKILEASSMLSIFLNKSLPIIFPCSAIPKDLSIPLIFFI